MSGERRTAEHREEARAAQETAKQEYSREELSEEEYDERMDILDAERSMAGESMLYDDGRQYSIEKEKGVVKEGKTEYNKHNMPTRPAKTGDTFPPYNESHSDANERATRWAHREDVDEGRQRIMSYHGGKYLMKKDSNAWLRYSIVKKLTQKEYARMKRYYGEDGEYVENSGQQQGRKRTVPYSEKDRKLDNDREGGSGNPALSDRYNRKTGSARAMVGEQNRGDGTENGRIGTDEYSVENRQSVERPQADNIQYAIEKDAEQGGTEASSENARAAKCGALVLKTEQDSFDTSVGTQVYNALKKNKKK